MVDYGNALVLVDVAQVALGEHQRLEKPSVKHSIVVKSQLFQRAKVLFFCASNAKARNTLYLLDVHKASVTPEEVSKLLGVAN